MKTQMLFVRTTNACLMSVLAFLLSQCSCCPPLSRTSTPSFTGCWLTEYSRPRDKNDSIKADIVYKEIPVEITVNADGTITGKWWSFPAPTDGMPDIGTLTGQIQVDSLIGKWGTDPLEDIKFRLSSTGLTFEGTYGPFRAWSERRRFFWNGTKVSNCKCPDSITQQNLKNKTTNQ